MAKKLEIEKKYLLKELPELPYNQVLHIFQYYLPDGSRIRHTKYSTAGTDTIFRGDTIPFPFGGNSKFELTRKKKIKAGVYEEDERKISENKFDTLKNKASSYIIKIRYVYNVGKLKWEIDAYRNGLCMVTAEIELPRENYKFKIPAEIQDQMIMDVTEFPQFTNKSLSNKIK